MLQLVDWLILVTALPTRNAAARMRLWRALKAAGCATLRDGVYLLPAGDATGEALRGLADAVRDAKGKAEVLAVAADGTQDAAFRELFDRSADYGRLLAAIRAACADTEAAALKKAASGLQREFSALVAIDYFPGQAQAQAQAALAQLQALAAGEPQAIADMPRRLASAEFQGRLWATRRHLWVDRLASAWLIRRFIDSRARFLWLESPADCPAEALGFDFDGARFTHVASVPPRVSFEVLVCSFGLDTDTALARIGAIVHFLDVGGAPVAEAAGIAAVLAGLRSAASDDDALLMAAEPVFDSLYRNFQMEKKHEH